MLLYWVRQAMAADGLVKDRKYHLRTYKKCCVGNKLVDYIMKENKCNRVEAVQFAELLTEKCLLEHVTQDHPFHDDKLFYRFLLPEDAILKVSYTIPLICTNQDHTPLTDTVLPGPVFRLKLIKQALRHCYRNPTTAPNKLTTIRSTKSSYTQPTLALTLPMRHTITKISFLLCSGVV